MKPKRPSLGAAFGARHQSNRSSDKNASLGFLGQVPRTLTRLPQRFVLLALSLGSPSLMMQLDIEESDQELELNTQGAEGEERRRQTSRVSYGILFSLRLLAAVSFFLLAFEVISHSSEIELELQLSNPAQRFWPWLTSLVTIHQDWATFRYSKLAPRSPLFQSPSTACILR